MGATSGAAPMLSGAAILFKEWYLGKFGDNGMDPGRILANLLNMGDRYGGGGASLQPVAGWGIGRFRLKNWDSAFRSRRRGGLFVTTRLELGAGETAWISIDRPETGKVASTVRSLNCIAWWDEPNTGRGQNKALIYVMLLRRNGATWELVDSADNDNGSGGEQYVSLTFDNCDARKPCIEGGYSYALYVVAASVPYAEVYGDGRVVYLSSVWESDGDDTLIDCAAPIGISLDTALCSECEGRPSNRPQDATHERGAVDFVVTPTF